MQLETAQSLVASITTALEAALDAQNRLDAFEKAVEKYEPNMYQCYLENLREIRKAPRVSLNLEGLARLQELLTRS